MMNGTYLVIPEKVESPGILNWQNHPKPFPAMSSIEKALFLRS